ncbi:LysE family translocator [Thalassobaculum sp.]|uniref:LysE family translocator n=1 Tax=Thalassobaculum sp. TaxID=2022740 RepID=UPI0032EBAE2B
MPSSDLLIPFFLASMVFACVPGPGMLYAAAQTLASGRQAGWLSALGFHIAGLGHVAAAAFGVSALLAVVPPLFIVMKLAGAAYLIWLGIRYLRGAPVLPSAPHSPSAPTARRALRDSVIVEAMNPKSALFHLAFLPQFTDASAGLPVWVQIVVLGVAVNAMFSMTDAILIETSHAIAAKLRASERFISALQKVGGGILVGLGVNLALARNQ